MCSREPWDEVARSASVGSRLWAAVHGLGLLSRLNGGFGRHLRRHQEFGAGQRSVGAGDAICLQQLAHCLCQKIVLVAEAFDCF